MSRNGRRLFAAAVLGSMATAGCGDGEDAGPASSITAIDTTAAPAAGEATAPTVAASTTPPSSGSPGTTEAPAETTVALDPDAEPVRLGYRNLEAAVPQLTIGFEQGIAYANEVLGGINGRPIEIAVDCTVDGTPESAVDCANQIVEGDVVLSVQGVDPSADAALPGLIEAGIAETGVTAFGPVQQADVGHSFMFTNPAEVAGIASVVALSDVGATTIRFFAGDTPISRRYQEFVVAAGEQLGVDADMIFHPEGAPDWAALIATAQTEGADGIGLLAAPEAECTGMIGAAGQVGFDGPMLAANCRDFVDAVPPETSENVYTFMDLFPPDSAGSAPPEKAGEVNAYVDWMTAAGHEDLLSTFAATGFALALTVQDVLSQIDDGDLSAADVLERFPTAEGERFMGGPYRCDGSAWPGSSVCQTNVVVLRQRADGTREVASDGFLDLTGLIPG